MPTSAQTAHMQDKYWIVTLRPTESLGGDPRKPIAKLLVWIPGNDQPAFDRIIAAAVLLGVSGMEQGVSSDVARAWPGPEMREKAATAPDVDMPDLRAWMLDGGAL